jgi:hypothetical protein
MEQGGRMHVREIDFMVRRGVPFERIEARIEELPLPADVKSVLWLYAWAETDRPARRQVVRELLAALPA